MKHDKLKGSEGERRRLYPPVREAQTGERTDVLWTVERVERDQVLLRCEQGMLALQAIDVKCFHAPDVLSVRVQVIRDGATFDTQRLATTEVIPLHANDILERAIEDRYDPMLEGFGGKLFRPELPLMKSQETRNAWFAQCKWNPDGSVSLPLGEHSYEDTWWGARMTEFHLSREQLRRARRALEEEQRDDACHPLEGFGNAST